MFHFAIHSASFFKPALLQLRVVGAFSLLGIVGWSLIGFLMDAIAQAQRMHRIPCTKCRFFTGDYRLKCTVKPSLANTEQAIGCGDYSYGGDYSEQFRDNS